MTSLKKTVSVLTAAGLVLAPVSGVVTNPIEGFASEATSGVEVASTSNSNKLDEEAPSEEALDTEGVNGETPNKETSGEGKQAGTSDSSAVAATSSTTSGTETPDAETPAGETPKSETPAGETPSSETLDTESPDVTDTPDAETPSAPDTPDTETPSAPDTPDTDTPSAPDADDSNEDATDAPSTNTPSTDTATTPSTSTSSNASSNTNATESETTQSPLLEQASQVPSLSFNYIDNSSYVARHYTEDLTTEKFIALISESARTIASENDLYASVMIAQAILESASGNSTLSQAPNNNLFGIKGSYNGNSVLMPTREDTGTGSTYSITAQFRKYANISESLADYADLLTNSMGDFYKGARKSSTETFVDACNFLVGRYATDIFYSQKLQDLIETYDLTRFDTELTYEETDVYVLPAIDEETGEAIYLDPVEDALEYQQLVAEYEEYLARTADYQEALQDWEDQKSAAEDLYNVPVYLEEPENTAASTERENHQNAVDEQRFEGFDELIENGSPLPVREERTLNDLTTLATSFMGLPYVWGGSTPSGFDCSGLVQYCYREVFGIELPRTTYYQCDEGEEVAFEDLRAGDLLFFEKGGTVYHVAMYLGDGYYVESPSTGDVVKITAMSDKMPQFAKRIVDTRDIDLSEYSDEELQQFVDREQYLQEREDRLGVTDEALEQLTEWLQGLDF